MISSGVQEEVVQQVSGVQPYVQMVQVPLVQQVAGVQRELHQQVSGIQPEVDRGDGSGRDDEEQISLYPQPRNFDRTKDVWVFRFGVMCFGCESLQSARSLQTQLCRLFVEPTARSPAPFRCPDSICEQEFQTVHDVLLHIESRCSYSGRENIILRSSPSYYPAHFVCDLALKVLEVTATFDAGPLDLIDIRNLPFRFGSTTVKHLLEYNKESQAERQMIGQGRRIVRDLLGYATMKSRWLLNNPRIGRQRQIPHLWYLSFLKHPEHWPAGTNDWYRALTSQRSTSGSSVTPDL